MSGEDKFLEEKYVISLWLVSLASDQLKYVRSYIEFLNILCIQLSFKTKKPSIISNMICLVISMLQRMVGYHCCQIKNHYQLAAPNIFTLLTGQLMCLKYQSEDEQYTEALEIYLPKRGTHILNWFCFSKLFCLPFSCNIF